MPVPMSPVESRSAWIRSTYGSGGVFSGGGQVSVFHGVFRVGMNDVPDLMTDNGEYLVIVHDFHQSATYAYTSVSTGESVYIYYIIYFKV